MNEAQKMAMQEGRRNALSLRLSQRNKALNFTDHQKRRLVECERGSPKYTGILKQAYSGGSKAAGIKAKCLDCCCYQRLEVEKCRATGCPLWAYRPYQNGGEE